MAFHHVPTFLRSAIARDPFCHGGLITPEDVLRLEAKFPTLFDKPALPEAVKTNENSSDEDDHVENNGGIRVDVKSKVTSKQNPRQTKPVQSNNNKRATTKEKVAQPPQGIKRIQTITQRRKPSEFHKKCVENVPSVPIGQGKKVVTTVNRTVPKTAAVTTTKTKGHLGHVSSSSKLARPAQSFSLEDLRATLRQVMEEDANLRNKWQRSDNSPSPYTEDLVQKFLGWKMTQDQKQKAIVNRNVHTFSKFKGQGDHATSKLKALTDTIVVYHENPSIRQGEWKNKMSTQTAKMGRGRGPPIIPRVRSAPGFIRGFPELPPVPNYQKKRMMQSMTAKINDGNKQMRQTRSVQGEIDGGNLGGGDGESGRKHVRWEEEDDEYDDEDQCHHDYHESESRVKHGISAERQSSQESIKSNIKNDVSVAVNQKPNRSGMRGTQIHLRSQKTLLSEQETAEAAFAQDDRYKVESSYNDLLTARSEKTRYEVKGYLRKQEVSSNFHKKQLERERAERKSQKARHDVHFMEPESSSDPSDNFTRKMKQMGQQSKQETNKILEAMAKELVYMEVLHQINELKREQKEDAELEEHKRELPKSSQQQLASSTSSSPRQQRDKLTTQQGSLPNFVPTTTDQEGSESAIANRREQGSKSSSDAILKTPELTPPSASATALKRMLGDKKKLSPRVGNDKVDLISLHTPELSPSPKRLIAAIKERRDLEKKLLASSSPPQQQQLDTDCSEMSDFVFSEPSRREKSQNEKMASVQEEKSAKLDTPLLSVSQPVPGSADKKPFNADQNETPEKDESTLNSVPTTFLETPSESQKVDQKPEASVHSENQKYSDDFTSENVSEQGVSSGSSLAVPPVRHADDAQSDADPHDNLNTSGETVIDMLSDGEFLGTSYRSPGELSWGQQQHTQPRPLAELFSNASVDLLSNGQLNKHNIAHASSIVKRLSFTSSTMESNDEEDSSISILSYGAQILSGNAERADHVSVGEYLHT